MVGLDTSYYLLQRSQWHWVKRQCGSNQKKSVEFHFFELFTQLIRAASPNDAELVIPSINWRISIRCTFLFISISIPLAISVPPFLPCHLHLPRHIHLYQNLYPLLIERGKKLNKRKRTKVGARSLLKKKKLLFGQSERNRNMFFTQKWHVQPTNQPH
jgi:hypothetical protein